MEAVFVLGLLVAVVAAIRGVWSPCGLSMLSSITPMTEAGRGNRFSVTARWFLAGAIVGGVTLGSVAAVVGAAISLADPSTTVRWALGAVLAMATAGIDLGAFGIDLPIFKRQVNDAWLRQYRSRVYGAGFGWQIGVGVATYIMTAGVFLTIGLAVLVGDPWLALAIGLTFGIVRGSAVYLGRSATTPAALGAVHARLDAFAPASRVAAAGVQVVAAAVLAGLAWGPLAAAVVVVAAAATVAVTARAHGRPAATA